MLKLKTGGNSGIVSLLLSIPNNTLSKGIKSVKLRSPKTIENNENMVYGIAMFPKGLAKDKSLRYVFIKYKSR